MKPVQFALAAPVAGLVARLLASLLVLAVTPAGAQTLIAQPGPPSPPSPPEEAVPPTPPLVLLLDGLGVYVESDYIGVSALARPLARQGFRTRTDSHLMLKTKGMVPDVIIGHSMGGETALRYATELARAGYPPPLVITIDAAPAPPACTVPRCINIAGPGFSRVRGAENVSAWAAGARFRNHAQLPTHPAVQELILKETAGWMAGWQARTQLAGAEGRQRKPATGAKTAASEKPSASQKPSASAKSSAGAKPSGTGTPAATTAPVAPSTAQKMWTVPSWSLPDWAAPNWPGLSRQGG